MSMHPGGGAASRTLRAIFSVDTSQAEKGLDRVASKAEQTADRMAKAGQSADKLGSQVASSTRQAEPGLVRMARSAEQNGAAWRQVGGTLTAVGAATTGLGLIVAKTGVEYNTLRQTSTAALTTLLGSAEAANAQMAKLDDFASNSPFARQVFIQAQRQLIGFGMAAEDVLPTLDAIQNAVAATGGSNHDIAELTRIIAQVGAAGKISAVDLMQFGQRGVDAATLIGSQMGKTGAQIRDEITDGTLDADAAIAALTAGMQERFGGAAENVKNTMAGAFDRVKAAFRDLSASLMSSAVDPTGGGWLVDLTNRIADLMRWFERAPGPIRNTALALGGLSGVAALAAGGLMLVVPRAVETYRALQDIGVAGPRTGRVVRGVGSAARAAAGPAMLGLLLVTLSQVGQKMLDTGQSANELENRLKSLSRGGDIDALVAGADGVDDFNRALQGVADPSLWGRIDNGVTDFFDGIFAVVTAGHDGRDALDQFRKSLPDLDAALAQMAASSLPDAVAGFRSLATEWDLNDRGMTALIDTLPGFRDHLVGVATEMGLAADNATLLKIATGELAPAADTAAGAQAGLSEEALATAEAAAAQEEAIQELRDAYEEWVAELGGVSASFATLEGALKAHQDATRTWAEEQASATKSGKDSWEDFYDGFSVDLGKYLDELASMVEAQANWQTNIESLVGRVSDATLDHLARLGPEGAPLVAALVDGSAAELARFDELFAASGQGAGEAWAVGLREQQAVFDAAARQLGDSAAQQILQAIQDGELTVAQAVEQYDLKATLEVAANTDPAAADLLEYVTGVELTTATAKVASDTSLALGGVQQWYYDTERMMPVPRVSADTGLAAGATSGWVAWASRQTATARLSADASSAYSTLWGFLNSIPRSVSVGISAIPMLGGLGRILSGGYATGGHTGPGARLEPKGVVHGDEFVHTKSHVNKPGMLAFHTDLWRTDDLDAAYRRYKLRGYDSGGPVGKDVIMRTYASERRFSYAAAAPAVPSSTPVAAAIDYDRLAAALSARPAVAQVEFREVAHANRRGEQSFGAPGRWSGAPRLGRSGS